MNFRKMYDSQRFNRYLFVILLLPISFLFACNNDEDIQKNGEPYDPSKPIELVSFYPDSGRYQEKIMLTGKNFGTDPSQIRVWFNQKRAPVIGSTGTRMYVQAPRLPGDTCTISIAIGNDSVVYNEQFRYFSSVTVTTIAGNGSRDVYQDGDLASSVLLPRYLCVDNENNIFVVCRGINDTSYPEMNVIARIDEEANELITISRGVAGNAPAADMETGIITFPTETSVGSFYTLDPKEFWGPRIREMKWQDNADIPAKGWKHSMAVNPVDGYIYTRYHYGDIVRMDPSTFEVETIYKTQQGDSYGLTFNPLHPNILFMSFRGNAGVNAHSICSIDVTDPENTFQKLSGPSTGGHRDGELGISQFREPAQIYCDTDGSIYVADGGNHCIRRITPEGMVETVLGMPGTSGWKDGGKEEALFYTPTGIGIGQDGSIYVADHDNNRVRKLSIN